MRFFNYLALVIILSACEEQVIVEKGLDRNTPTGLLPFYSDTLVNLGRVSLALPKGWRFAKDDTLIQVADATARYRFHNRKGKLIHLQYGLATSGNPSEPNVASFRFRNGYVANAADTSDLIFTDHPRLARIRAESGYKYADEQISAFKSLFYYPKTIGKGYTGVYIDSFGEIAGNIADFTFYAEDLDSAENIEVTKVLRSIIFKSYK